MTINVSPTTPNPTHHIKLSAGSNEVGLILRSNNRIDPRAITRRPRQQGQYSPFTQSDWSSGRGIKDAASERSRFADSKRAITRHSGMVMNSGQETYTTGYRQAEQYMPGNVTWQSLLTTERYIAYKFTASATGNRSAISLWVRRRGTPTSTLTVELCSDNTDAPGTVLKTVTATTTNITDAVSQLYEFVFSSVQAVTATTVYWIKIYTSTADTAPDYWQVGTDAARTNALTKSSSDNGSTDAWAAATYDLYFRIVDDTDLLGGLFFTYKGQLYFVTRQSGSTAPKLYMNGYRGVATGTHSTTTIQDTTQSFTADALIGATLQIIEGTNSEWQTPYRIITDNDGDTLTFSPAFPKVPVSNDTVYVITGSNVWTEITGHGLTVLPTSVVQCGDFAFFAQGDSVDMRRMREFMSAGAWTRSFSAEANRAKIIATYRSQSNGLMLVKANDYNNSGAPSFAQAPYTNKRIGFPQLITDCSTVTGWTFGVNVTGGLDTSVWQTGFTTLRAAISMVVAAGAPQLIGYHTVTKNILNEKRMRMWVFSTENLAAGDLKLRLSGATDCSTSIQDISLPIIPAGDWQQIVVPFTDNVSGLTSVKSFGFLKTAASGTIYVDGIETYPNGDTPLGSTGEKITGIELYGDPEVPWIFRTQSAGSIENGIFTPIPLREFSTAESIHNGAGHTVHNVYLYISFLHGLERFYRNNLDDVGPNRDEGMPENRRGFITDMKGYIGRFFYNYDVQDGYSCIMESASGTDHHEVYRCDTPGKRIRSIFLQIVPGDTADRLWFTEGEDIAWLPLPGNTLKEDTDDTFRHTHEAVMESGWMYGTEQDAVKLFHSVKLFTENLSANRKIEWDYKTDEGLTWTTVSTAFTSSPVQEIAIDVSAKRLKIRFRLQTNDSTETPQIKTMFVSATTRPETRFTYSMSTYTEDLAIDIQGNENSSTDAADVIAQLDAWMEANTILTMNSVFTAFDNKQVILEPAVITPLSIITDESKEKLLLTINLLEP